MQAEHARRLLWIDWKVAVEVPEMQGAILEAQLELSPFDDAAVLVAQHGQQHLPLQFRLYGVPVDVEEVGEGRTGTVLEHVAPPRIRVGIGRHVVRDDVDDVPEPVGFQGVAERVVIGLGAELGLSDA